MPDTRHMVQAAAEKTEGEISSVASAAYTQSDSSVRKLSAVEIKLVYRKQMYYGNKSVYQQHGAVATPEGVENALVPGH